MNMLDAWLYVKPAGWDAYVASFGEFISYHIANSYTGAWKTWNTEFEVYAILATQQQLDALVLALGADCDGYDPCEYGSGMDAIDPVTGAFMTIPARMVAVMPDHVTYDAAGVEIGREAAAANNPNWGRYPAGQAIRAKQVAGKFNIKFNGKFK